MNANEFLYWIRGIVDSTDDVPSKEVWQKITEVVNTVKLNKNEVTPFNDAVVHRFLQIQSSNPHEVKGKSETKKN